jgi:hypothetical protein
VLIIACISTTHAYIYEQRYVTLDGEVTGRRYVEESEIDLLCIQQYVAGSAAPPK